MNEARTDAHAPSAFFLLTGALRGHAPEGPPPPRVLDVLVFARAQARFRAVATAGDGAAGDLPWRVLGVEEVPAEGVGPPAVGSASFVRGDSGPAPRPDAPVANATTEERPAAAAAVAAPSAAVGEGGDVASERVLRFRQPAVPAVAPPPGVPPSRTERDPESPSVNTTSPAQAGAREPVVFGAPPPAAALPFAPRLAVPPVAVPLEERAPSPSAAEPVPPEEPTPAPATTHADVETHLPWASPLRLEPPFAHREPADPVVRAAWRFVPSPARTAAETAARVARAVDRAETVARQEVAQAAATDTAHAASQPPRIRPAGERPLTAGGLLGEVTRDEVVRALAERMQALARDDRFRLGELR